MKHIELNITGGTESQNVEEAVLGACLIEKGAFEKVASLLKDGDFLNPAHRSIWQAMCSLSAEGTPIDMISVATKSGGKFQDVARVAHRVSSSENIQHHAYILKQKSLASQLAMHSYEVQKDLNEGKDPIEVLAGVHKAAEAMTNRLFDGRKVTHAKSVDDELQAIFDAMNSKTPEPRTHTGFTPLDTILNGLKKGDLAIVAARPAMGKTAFVLNIAANVCKKGGKVAFFSLEMTRGQLLRRMLSSEAQVVNKDIDNAHMLGYNSACRLNEAAAELREWKLFTSDSASETVLSIRSQCAQFKNEQGGLDLIIVDYLQLMQDAGKSQNREQEIASISRGLKILAKDMGCPLIALSQLSRKCEERADKRPMLSDLRESGAIEQDADTVMFVYRPEVYFEEDEEGNSLKNKAEIIVQKNRNGELGTADLNYYGQYFLFTEQQTSF